MKSYPFARGAFISVALALMAIPIVTATDITVREDSSGTPMPLPDLESSIDPGIVVIAEDHSNDDGFVVIVQDRSNDTGFLMPADDDAQIAPDDGPHNPIEDFDLPTPVPATPVDRSERIRP